MDVRTTHVRLLVSDYGRSFRFYRDVLGFAVEWGDEASGYADFGTGGGSMAIYGRQAMAEAIGDGKMPADAFHQDKAALIFEVLCVDDVYRQLKEKGIVFVAEPIDHQDWGVRTAHFRDPDGLLIEINHPLE